MPRNNPLVTKRGLRKSVDKLVEAAQLGVSNALLFKGKKRVDTLCEAYARAETARYISVEFASYEAGEDAAFAVQEEIWQLQDARMNPMPGVPGESVLRKRGKKTNKALQSVIGKALR